MTRNRKKWIAIALGLSVALCAGAVAWGASTRGEPPAPWEGAAVERGDVAVRVTASGTVSARRTVLVSSQVSGRLQEIRVDFNSRVKKGDLLARIDPQPFEAAVAQGEANAAAARASLEKARAKAVDLERQEARKRSLAARDLIAREEWETSEADLAVARAEVQAAQAAVAQARAALDQSRFNLAQTAIRAPIDGIVVSRDVDVGQTVAASLQAPTLFTLAEDLRLMQVEAHVSESDVGRLKEGMEATFTVDAWPKERIQGTVRQVRNAAETVQNVVTYDVIVDVENAEGRLRPGMTANVTFVVEERRGVLRVPNAALRFKPAAAGPAPAARAEAAPASGAPRPDARTLWVVEGAALRPLEVRAGLTDGSFTEVEGDVREGLLVATRASGAAPAEGAATAAARSRNAAGGPPPPRIF